MEESDLKEADIRQYIEELLVMEESSLRGAR